MTRYETKNDLPEATRSAMAELLNQNLANGVDLVFQAKQAHWNVKGPMFFMLHELFDKLYGASTEWVDSLAERAVQLGGTAQGTVRAAAAASQLPEYPKQLARGLAHVEALSSSLAVFGKGIREGIATAEKAGDMGTADLFTEISRGSDELLWFIEAHLQKEE